MVCKLLWNRLQHCMHWFVSLGAYNWGQLFEHEECCQDCSIFTLQSQLVRQAVVSFSYVPSFLYQGITKILRLLQLNPEIRISVHVQNHCQLWRREEGDNTAHTYLLVRWFIIMGRGWASSKLLIYYFVMVHSRISHCHLFGPNLITHISS